jgi:hypothetical protein
MQFLGSRIIDVRCRGRSCVPLLKELKLLKCKADLCCRRTKVDNRMVGSSIYGTNADRSQTLVNVFSASLATDNRTGKTYGWSKIRFAFHSSPSTIRTSISFAQISAIQHMTGCPRRITGLYNPPNLQAHRPLHPYFRFLFHSRLVSLRNPNRQTPEN